jgi:hypothetical protein
MAVRWGTALPGPFFMSWGRTPRERSDARRSGVTWSWGYLFLQLILWMTVGMLWLTWWVLVAMFLGIRYLVNAIRDSRRKVGSHDARLTPPASESPNQWSDRR